MNTEQTSKHIFTYNTNKFILSLQKMFTLANILMIWKNLLKFFYLKKEKKKDFYSYLNMEDITDADYRHKKNIFS